MAPSGEKGLELEEALRAYFWQAGYFAVRGLPIKLEGQDVTDVDTWLYERPAAAARRVMIVDAKNKRKAKAAERIIWTKGLAAFLGVDGAIVASTDAKSHSESLAKRAGVTFFNAEALARIRSSRGVQGVFGLSEDDLIAGIRQVDLGRKSSDWRIRYENLKSALIEGLGPSSLNKSLGRFSYFASQAVDAQPNSVQAVFAIRAALIAASFAMISIDYVSSELTFLGNSKKAELLANAVRFGAIDPEVALRTVKSAVGLIRNYSQQGAALANELEAKFFADAKGVNAEIVSDIVRKIGFENIFPLARELNRMAYQVELSVGHELSLEARAILGALLDFSEVDRRRFLTAGSGDGSVNGLSVTLEARAPSGDSGQGAFPLDLPSHNS